MTTVGSFGFTAEKGFGFLVEKLLASHNQIANLTLETLEMFRRTSTTGFIFLLICAIGTASMNMLPSALGVGDTIYVNDDNISGPWTGTISYPYQNITSGLEHASYGDIVHVFPGTYTENVVLDKSITLRGDSKPTVNGMGGIGINVTVHGDFSYGVTVEGFEVTNSSYGIYLSLQEIGNLNSTIVTIGDIVLVDNTINSSIDGIYAYIYDVGIYMYGNSTVSMGDFRVANNVIASDQTGIDLDSFSYVGNYMYSTSSFSMGNIEIANNTLISVYDGVYMGDIYSFGSYLYDESNFTMGNITVTGNKIESDYCGIMMDYFENFGCNMEDNSKFSMGNIEFSHNTINSSDAGIYIYEFYDLGCDMHDNARFTMGSICLNGNIINSSEYEGIWFGWGEIGYLGTNMHGNSSFEMGNIEFCGNTIDSLGSGMYIDAFYEYGYDMYDNSSFTLGSILVNNNTINSGEEGIYVDGFEYIGEDLYGTSSFTMDNIEFCGNVIDSIHDGIYIYEFYDFGEAMNQNSSLTMNNILVDNNEINSDEDGISVDYIEYFGRGMYSSSSFTMGNIEFSGNNITSLGDGMYFYAIRYFGEGMYDFSSFAMGDFSINTNNIVCGQNGIQIDDFRRFGTNVNDNAIFAMGNMELDGNDLSLSDSGMNFTNLDGAIIRNNKIWECSCGIELALASGNSIYHNKFLNNTVQASVISGNENLWDDEYPSGGNFWSDYVDVDENHGPYQNITGIDGIWDNAYVIDANNTDRYPFSYVSDEEPPEIGIPLRSPGGEVLPYQEVSVSTNVTDSVSGVKNVTLYYTVDDGETWTLLSMNNTSSNTYETTIPPQEAGTTVRFKILAYDYAGNNNTLDGIEPYCIYLVIPEFPVILLLPLFTITTLLAAAIYRRKSGEGNRRQG